MGKGKLSKEESTLLHSFPFWVLHAHDGRGASNRAEVIQGLRDLGVPPMRSLAGVCYYHTKVLENRCGADSGMWLSWTRAALDHLPPNPLKNDVVKAGLVNQEDVDHWRKEGVRIHPSSSLISLPAVMFFIMAHHESFNRTEKTRARANKFKGLMLSLGYQVRRLDGPPPVFTKPTPVKAVVEDLDVNDVKVLASHGLYLPSVETMQVEELRADALREVMSSLQEQAEQEAQAEETESPVEETEDVDSDEVEDEAERELEAQYGKERLIDALLATPESTNMRMTVYRLRGQVKSLSEQHAANIRTIEEKFKEKDSLKILMDEIHSRIAGIPADIANLRVEQFEISKKITACKDQERALLEGSTVVFKGDQLALKLKDGSFVYGNLIIG